MSVSTSIEACLQDLTEASRTSLSLKSIASDLATRVMADVDDVDRDYVCSLLFDPDNGILRFMRQNGSTKDSSAVSAVTTLLDFLVSFIQKAQTSLQRYAPSLKQCCVALINAPSSRVQSSALDVLATLLNPDISQLDTSVFRIDSLYEQNKRTYASYTKISASVRSRTLILMGTIARYYPSAITDNDVQTLKRWTLSALDAELKKNVAEHQILSGALGAMDALLSRGDVSLDQNELKQLYEADKAILDIPEKLSRYAAPTAALQLFCNHASLFERHLIVDSEILYSRFSSIRFHRNHDLSKLGFQAMDVLIEQTANVLTKLTPGHTEKGVFRFFFLKFFDEMNRESDNPDYRRVAAAIKGFGHFSKVFRKFMQQSEVDGLIQDLVKKSAWIFTEGTLEHTRLLNYIPSFIASYNQIIQHIDNVSSEFMATLTRAINVFVTDYRRLSSWAREQGTEAIKDTLQALYSKSEGDVRAFATNTFHNALIWTCTETRRDAPNEMQVYVEYLTFWKSIFQTEEPQSFDLNDQFLGVLYDSFLTALLRLLRLFNLEVTSETAPDTTPDKPTQGGIKTADDKDTRVASAAMLGTILQPVNEMDFVLFHNIVGFWCALVPQLRGERLIQWIQIAGLELIQLSIRQPLVSGFYRMLAIVITITDRVGCFRESQKLYHKEHEALNAFEPTSRSDVYVTYLSFRDFLKETRYRLQQFKDELLAACLQLVLTVPLTFFNIDEVVQPLQTALELGLTYHPLATTALCALDQITAPDAPTSSDLSFLGAVLPYLNKYLMDRQEIEEVDDSVKRRKAFNVAAAKKNFQRWRTLNEFQTSDYVSLRDLQLRILRFLGRLGGASKLMIQTPQHQNKNESTKALSRTYNKMLAWDPSRPLKVRLAFQGATVDLSFDELLPRMCDLAESSPDRKTKSAACEVLHALVLVMIGKSAHRPRQEKAPTRSPYHRIYVHVFPVLLRLAIDIDSIPRSMFRTLVFQLIHWLTSNAQAENPETIALLETCLEAVCDSNASLQSFGAECLQEFVEWSIKQSGLRQSGNTMNIKSLLKRLYNMASNPRPTLRLGAAIVINHIYRIYREEEPVVNEFTLELFYWMLFSLRLAENDHPSIGTREQSKNAISHVKRILREKAPIFLKGTPERRTFPGIEEPTLQETVAWAFQEIGQLERDYARSCMDFFSEFVLTMPGVQSAKDWFQERYERNESYITDILETQRLRPTQVKGDNAASCLLWLRQMNCALDGYVWLIDRDMVTVMTVLNQTSSVLLDACRYLVTEVPAILSSNTFGTFDRIQLNALYAYATYRLACFLNCIAASKESNDALGLSRVTDILFTEDLSRLLAHVFLLPDQLVEVIQAEQGALSTWMTSEKILHVMQLFLHAMVEKGPPKFLRTFAKSVNAIIRRDNLDVTQLQHDQGALTEMLQTLQGFKVLQSLKLFDMVCRQNKTAGHASSDQDYYGDMFDKFLEMRSSSDPLRIKLVGDMVRIAGNSLCSDSSYCQKLLSNDLPDQEQITVYEKFQPYINDCIALHFKTFAPILLADIEGDFMPRVIIGLVEYLKSNRKTLANEINCFTTEESYHMNGELATSSFLEDLIAAWKSQSKLLNLAAFLKGLFGADPGLLYRTANQGHTFGVFYQAIKALLDRDAPLSVKMEAFDVLPVYLTIQGEHVDRIIALVRDTASWQLGIKSRDLRVGSEEYNQYIATLDKIIDMMVSFRSTPLFNILLPLYIQEEDHVHAEAFKEGFAKFAKSLDMKRFHDLTETCLAYYKDDGNRIEIRRNVISLLVSLFILVPDEYVVNFYMDNILFIMTGATRQLLRRGTDEEIRVDMEEKTCCIYLMQTFYIRVRHGKQFGMRSEVSKKWEQETGNMSDKADAKGKIMMTKLVDALDQAKSEQNPQEAEVLAETRLRYHQMAYNTMTVAILNTQTKEAFLNGFLLKARKGAHWENIIDMKKLKETRLQIELDQPLMTTRLGEFRERAGFRKQDSGPRVNYIASMQLAGSSLAQATLSDMALEASGQASPMSIDEDEDTGDSADVNKIEEDEKEYGEVSGRGENELEMDIFNKNPCMTFLVQTIKRLHSTISPPDPTKPTPAWMNTLLSTFKKAENNDSGIPLRLFLAKVIINLPAAFEPYAELWIRPLMRLVAQGAKYGDPMNYFVQDLCYVILAWGKDVKLEDSYEDKTLLFHFTNYLMENAYYETARIAKNHVQIVKNVIENWEDRLIPPTKTMYSQFNPRDKNAGQIRVGLQLVGAFLVHDINPFYNGEGFSLDGLTEHQFYAAICDNMDNSSREVSATAAELAALALKLMIEKRRENVDVEGMIIEKLKRMDPLRQEKANNGKFLSCIYRVQTHRSEIANKFVNKVIYLLPSLAGDLKVLALQIVGRAVGELDDVFKVLESKGLLAMLGMRNVDAQIALLSMLDQIAPTLSSDNISTMLDTLVDLFAKHANVECRVLYFSILRKCYDTLMDISPLKDRINSEILKGLLDADKVIQQTNVEFVETRHGLKEEIFDVIQGLLSTAYTPSVEDMYILYGTYILLESAKKHQDYGSLLFDEPLPKARFDEHYQKIDTSWQGSTSMTPLFVATQEPSTVNPEELELQLRRTQQELAFSKTQDGYSGATIASTFQTPTPESLSNVLLPTSSAAEASQQATDSFRKSVGRTRAKTDRAYERIGKRFIKTSDRDSTYFYRNRHERQRKTLQSLEAMRKQQREKAVTMFRNYRIGELPDIQIKNSDLIVPLQALGGRDNDIARILHAHIVVSFSQYADLHLQEKRPDYMQGIVDLVQDKLARSILYFPPTIGAFLRVCLDLNAAAVDSTVVNTVSEKSQSQHAGIAVLEAQLISGASEALERPSKRKRTGGTASTHRSKVQWTDLATLYKSIDEAEVFRSLYVNHVASNDTVKDAVENEMRADYVEAHEKFMDAYGRFKDEADSRELDLWQKEGLRCLEQLAQWDDIAMQVRDTVEGNYFRLWDEGKKDPYLGAFVHSFTRLRKGIMIDQSNRADWTDDNPNPIYVWLSDAFQSKDKEEYLLQNHACDVTLVTMYQGKYERALRYLQHSYDDMLSLWSSLHPLAHVSRMARLSILQRTVELEEFLKIVTEYQRKKKEMPIAERVTEYVKLLQARYPDSKRDGTDVWDDIIQGRNMFIEDLKGVIDKKDLPSPVLLALNACFKSNILAEISAAKQQNNFTLAYNTISSFSELDVTKAEKQLVYLQLHLQWVLSAEDSIRASQLLGRGIGLTYEQEEPLRPLLASSDYAREYFMTGSKILETARLYLQSDPKLLDQMRVSKSFAKWLKSRGLHDAKSVANALVLSGTRYLQDILKNTVENTHLRAECVWRLAEYCDNALRANEDPSSKVIVKLDTNHYAQTIIQNYYESMSLDVVEAIERFPRLLELIELYPEVQKSFRDHAETFNVSWMYIRWLPQLVAILDTSLAHCVFPILQKVAKSYPSALYYPFRISEEHYSAIGSRLEKKNREEIEKIKQMIYSPLMEDFCTELLRLTNPDQLLKDFVDFLRSVAMNTETDKEYIHAMYRQFSELLLSPTNSSRYGAIPKAFATKHASQLRGLFGKDGSKLLNLSQRDLKRIGDYQRNIKMESGREAGLLKSYSPWLSTFQAANFSESIEVPGQYSGLSRPYPEYHARIASFDDRLLVMSSLRKPKRLKIYGSDGQGYLFLVKGGEDLRLDQRIEQLFGVMNSILLRNAYCARQNISVATYKVVPMASNIGIIEWVENTKPLKSCLDAEVPPSALISARKAYLTFVNKHGSSVTSYVTSYAKESRDSAVRAFEQSVSHLEPNYLRRYLLKLAASPEAFFFIRNGFANSLAVTSISGYVLGIGDRHLENLMVDLKSGRLVPIDFGHAFGSATEQLPVPELVPFRLTRQLVGTLAPLDVAGILETPMTHIMKAFRHEKSLLLNTMDVFIKEPLLDWRKRAMSQANHQKRGNSQASPTSETASTTSSSDAEIAWYPYQKIDIAKRKLAGENPAHIVATEVRNNDSPHVKAAIGKIEEVIMGDEKHNVRARIGPICSDTHQQVQALIDLATDPSILARIWGGWQAYL